MVTIQGITFGEGGVVTVKDPILKTERVISRPATGGSGTGVSESDRQRIAEQQAAQQRAREEAARKAAEEAIRKAQQRKAAQDLAATRTETAVRSRQLQDLLGREDVQKNIREAQARAEQGARFEVTQGGGVITRKPQETITTREIGPEKIEAPEIIQQVKVSSGGGVDVFKTVVKQTGKPDRPATKAEELFFREQTAIVQASGDKAPGVIKRTVRGAVTSFTEAEKRFAQRSTVPVLDFIGDVVSPVTSRANIIIQEQQKRQFFPGASQFSFEFVKGVGSGVVSEVRDKPITNIGLALLGGGVGAVSKVAKTTKAGVAATRAARAAPGATGIIKGVAVGGLGSVASLSVVQAGQEGGATGAGQQTGKIITEAAVFGVGFGKGAKFAKLKTEIIPLRAVETPKFTEVTRPAQIGDVRTRISAFEIRGEVLPPRARVTQSSLRESLGLPPKKVTILPAKRFTVKTLEPVVGKQPFRVLQKIEGRKGEVIQIKGVSETADPFIPKGKTSIERFLEKRFVQEQGAISDADKFFKSALEVEKQFVKTQAGLSFIPPGKRITRFQTFGKETIIAESDIARLTKSELLLKETTKPLARAVGQTPKLEGQILEIKEPIIIGKDSQVKFVQPADITKTPLSQTFVDQIAVQLPKGGLPKVLPKITTPKVVTVTEAPPQTVLGFALPRGVGGTGLTETQIKAAQGPAEQPGVISSVGITPDGIQKPGQVSIQKIGLAPALKSSSQLKELQKQKDVQVIKSIEVVKPISATKTIQVQQQVQQQKQIQQLKQILLQKPITQTKTPQVKTPKTILTPIPIPSLAQRLAKKVDEAPGGFFEVFGKVEQKDISLGVFGTQAKAEQKLTKFLKGTLGAGGFLEKEGKKVKIKQLKTFTSDEFRKSKVDPSFRIIQKKEKRLKKGDPQTKEIQFFKKSKSKSGLVF